MYAFEAIEQLGHADLAWEFNGKTEEQAAKLCRIHGISNAEYVLDNWDRYDHITGSIDLKTVFSFAGMSHLLDEFAATVRTREQAREFIKRHKLKPHQAENIRLHWKKVNSESQR